LARGLEILAASTIRKPAFAEAMASHLFVGLNNRPLLGEPKDPMAPDYAPLSMAYDTEQKAIRGFAQALMAANYDLRALVIAIVKSPQFRAIDADQADRLDQTSI